MESEKLAAHAEMHIEALKETLNLHAEEIAEAEEIIYLAYLNGKKTILCGNGGSFADAQHMAGEFGGAYRNRKRLPLPALVAGSNSAELSAVANDFGYPGAFARFVEANASPGDVVIGFSTSGKSPNVIEALKTAKQKGAYTIAFTGKAGLIEGGADVVLKAETPDTPRVQEVHEFLYHEICDGVEGRLFPIEN